MRTIFLATKEQVDLARHLEQVLLGLHPASGILFVGAEVRERHHGDDPPDGTWGLFVTVGCSRSIDRTAVEALVWSIVDRDPELVKVRDHIHAHVYRGVARSS